MIRKLTKEDMVAFKKFKINLEDVEITIKTKNSPKVSTVLKFEKGMKCSPYDESDMKRMQMDIASGMRALHRLIWERV